MRHRSPLAFATILLGVALVGHPSDVFAEASTTPGVRIDQLQPASPESMFFRVEGPHDPDATGVEFAAGLTFEYAHDLLKENIIEVDGTTTQTMLVRHALFTRFGASITPIHWLALELSIPVALYESGSTPVGDPDGRGLVAGKGPGAGDLRIGVHFRPIDTKTFGLIVGGRVWAPFGSQATFLSDGTVRAEIDLGVAGELERALYGCTLNIAPGFFGARRGDRLAASCAGYYKVNPTIAFGLEPAFEVVTQAKIPLGSAPAGNVLGVIFEPLVGLRIRASGFRFGFAAGPGFGGTMGAADARVLANFAYVGLGKPPKPIVMGPSDRDLDGIPDAQDACPDEAGPRNDDPKRNGCPTHDRDGDGIPDALDFCPDRAGIRYPDPKANGCPDSDNDGLPDPIDKCVNEPGPPPSGCPKFAHLGSGGFNVDPPIDFGASDKLKPDARRAVEEIAATMRANPKIEQVSFQIGTKGAKPALSDKRAQEILLILQAVNLDSSRFEVVLKDDARAGSVVVRLVK